MIHKVKTVVLLGTGKVSAHTALALKQAGVQIVQVYGRQQKKASEVAQTAGAEFTSIKKDIRTDADLYLIAVSDDAVADVVSWLPKTNKIIAHTSGLVSQDVFKPHFENFGVFYPLQTFTKGRHLDFQAIPIFIEASNSFTQALLYDLANRLSSTVVITDSYVRSKIHLAAVFACNFPNFMYSIAHEIIREAELPFDLLRPLILETAAKALEMTPEAAQTGPALRNDKQTIEAHLSLLKGLDTSLEVYNLLTNKIIEKYNTSNRL